MFTEKDIALAKKIESQMGEFLNSGKLDYLESSLAKLFTVQTFYLAKLENENKELRAVIADVEGRLRNLDGQEF